ncbi:MAG TPA: hypothetical protein VFI90_01085 [Rubrobacter sp.]|nr:hypothetical protein [Rubrobacter sp.]
MLLRLVCAALILAMGCSEDRQETNASTITERPAPEKAHSAPTGPVYGYTYGEATGNRLVEGQGRLQEAKPVDVELSGTPDWVAGAALEEDTAWVVTYTSGKVDAFRLDEASGEVGPWLTVPDRLPPGAPPLVVSEEDRLDLATLDRCSPLTHPVPTKSGLLGVTPDGLLTSESGEEPAVSAPADARIVESEGDRLAVLSDPTTRYIHGVLGDAFEAGSITILEDGREGYTMGGRIEPESGGFFETLAPLWFRPGGDEEELLAVTESTERMGSRISVYSPGGSLVAAGPFVGEPQRWRHLIAAGPFGPEGEVEIAAVRTPHVGGQVEFYRLNRDEGTLEIAASGGHYLSHTIYSRNLDAARAGDLDGDGRWELLLPTSSYKAIEAVRHTRSGVEPAWRLPLGGNLATNLASAADHEGRVVLAAGTLEGELRIWR